MAENKAQEQKKQLNLNMDENEVATKPSKFKIFLLRIKRFFKILFIVLLLMAIILGGFFLGVYLRVFDVNTVNEKLELYKYPILSEYFVKPDSVMDNQTSADEKSKDDNGKVMQETNGSGVKAIKQSTEAVKPVTLTKEDIEKQIKQSKIEEKKRISKLARLYEQMKPEDAVKILDELSDDMIIAILGKMDEAQVSKILVKFDADKSARLTKMMYNGKPPVTQIR